MFSKDTYLVRERVGFLKLADVYDIYEGDTGQQVAIAVEKPGTWVYLARFAVNKRLLPTSVRIGATADGPAYLTIRRGFTFLRSKIWIENQSGQRIGYFKSKLLSLGGGFYVHDVSDKLVAEVKGDWKGWNFKFVDSSGNEVGQVSKKWAGIAKELFTSADNYVIHINNPSEGAGALLMAAGIAIDTVFKEK